MEHVTIKVDGMTCMGCVGSVTRVLSAVDGVSNVAVSLEQGRAELDIDPARASLQQLRTAIEDAGFEPA